MNAPNRIDVVRDVLRDLVNVDPSKEGERGQITDEVVRRLGGVPWGRKDRDRDPNNNNNSDDALCHRKTDGRFEIIDILAGLPSGSSREKFATWNTDGSTFADGENGYFREVLNVEPLPGPAPGPVPPTPVPPMPPKPAFVGPSLHDWTLLEWPKVRDARRTVLKNPTWNPDPEWVILQMARRYGLGLAENEEPWTLKQMIDWELKQ